MSYKRNILGNYKKESMLISFLSYENYKRYRKS